MNLPPKLFPPFIFLTITPALYTTSAAAAVANQIVSTHKPFFSFIPSPLPKTACLFLFPATCSSEKQWQFLYFSPSSSIRKRKKGTSLRLKQAREIESLSQMSIFLCSFCARKQNPTTFCDQPWLDSFSLCVLPEKTLMVLWWDRWKNYLLLWRLLPEILARF